MRRPLPAPLVELWRTSFGDSLDYDLAAELDGQHPERAALLRELADRFDPR